MEQLRHSGLFTSRVPRYTSYPPANQFIPAEGRLNHDRWLSSIPHGARLSAYVHVPYCRELCWFCACRTQAVEGFSAIERYVEMLQREIAIVRAKLPKKVSLSRLYLGGGTPTMMLPTQIQAFLDTLYEALPRAENFEFFVEVDATSVSQTVIDSLIDRGMTRAVVAVHDFDPQVQKAIGRRRSFEQTLNAVRHLREAGLQNLDMELLYGLPRQSVRSIAETTQQVLALEPDRIAVCEYAHIPRVAKRQILIDTHLLPSAEKAFSISRAAHQILTSDGYEPVGIDHFVRLGDSLLAARESGQLRRDFQGYSDDAAHALIGFGASAISRFPLGFVQNAAATSVYGADINNGRLAGNRGYSLIANDRLVAGMIEMLMCRFELRLDDIVTRFPAGREFAIRAIRLLSESFEQVLDVTPERLAIKPNAYPVARLLCNALDEMGRNEAVA
ncbi:MAG: radical SAM protein [Pseudomonadota bacterium]